MEFHLVSCREEGYPYSQTSGASRMRRGTSGNSVGERSQQCVLRPTPPRGCLLRIRSALLAVSRLRWR